MDIASLFADVVHEQILAEGVGRGEVGLAAAEFGDFLDEVDQAVIAGEHESIDENPGAFALRNFFQSLGDDQRIQAKAFL